MVFPHTPAPTALQPRDLNAEGSSRSIGSLVSSLPNEGYHSSIKTTGSDAIPSGSSNMVQADMWRGSDAVAEAASTEPRDLETRSVRSQAPLSEQTPPANRIEDTNTGARLDLELHEKTVPPPSSDITDQRLASSTKPPGSRPQEPGTTRSFAVKQEIVEIHRTLYARDPEKHCGILASSLHDLGFALHELHLFEDACAAYKEAVSLRRTLYAADPEAYRAPLARSLHDLGWALYKLHLYEEASAATEEAVSLFRRCYAANPEAHGTDLTWALNSLDIFNKSLGRS